MSETKPKLTLECGFDALDKICEDVFKKAEQPYDSRIHFVDKARIVGGLIKSIDIEFLFYSSFQSRYSGARTTSEWKGRDFIIDQINVLNDEGMSFIYTLNGTVGLDSQLFPFDKSEEEVLKLLSFANDVKGVSNKVTIANDKLLNQLKEKHPSLDVISSCVGLVEPRNEKTYSDLFRDYDYVVPLSQHTTYDFLSQYEEHADKMIPFLKLGCAMQNLDECYTHFIESEKNMRLRPNFTLSPQGEYPHAAANSCDGCYNEDFLLLNRDSDLRGLMEMGVDKYKLHRRSRFPMGFDELRSFVKMFLEVKNETKEVNEVAIYEK